ASEHALDAHRGYLLYLLLPAGAQPRICPDPAAQSATEQASFISGVRASTAQTGSRTGGGRHVAVFLSSGISGRTLRCAARAPVRVPHRFLIWPSTFFLFILSAIASGPSFLMLITATVEKVTGRKLVPQELLRRLGFISGLLLGVYVAGKSIDTLIWLNYTSPAAGFAPWQYYQHKPFGTPILFAEIVLLGLLPAFLLTFRKTASSRVWLLTAAAMACTGVLLNRFVLTVQTLALP